MSARMRQSADRGGLAEARNPTRLAINSMHHGENDADKYADRGCRDQHPIDVVRLSLMCSDHDPHHRDEDRDGAQKEQNDRHAHLLLMQQTGGGEVLVCILTEPTE